MMHRYIFLALLVGVLTACSGSTVQATEPGQQEVATDAVASRTPVATDFVIVTHTPKPTVTQVAVEPTAAPTDVPPTEASDTQTLADGSVLTFVDGVPTKVERDGKAYAFTNEFVDYGTGWQYWNGKEMAPVPLPADVQAVLSGDIADLEPADKDVRPVLEKATIQLDEAGQLRFVLGPDLKNTPIGVFKDGQWITEFELVVDKEMLDKLQWNTEVKNYLSQGKIFVNFLGVMVGGVKTQNNGKLDILYLCKDGNEWRWFVGETPNIIVINYRGGKSDRTPQRIVEIKETPLTVVGASQLALGVTTWTFLQEWMVVTNVVAPVGYTNGRSGWAIEVDKALGTTNDPEDLIRQWQMGDLPKLTDNLTDGAYVPDLIFSER